MGKFGEMPVESELGHKSAGRPLKNMWSPVELYVSDEGDEVGYYVKIEYTDTQLITGRVITTFLSVSKDTGELGQVVRKGKVGEWVPMKGEPYNPRRPYFVFVSQSCPLLIYRIRLDNDGNVVEEHLWYAEIGKKLGEHGFLVYVKPRAEVGNEVLVGRVRGVVLGGGRERLVTGAAAVGESTVAAAGEEGPVASSVDAAAGEEEGPVASSVDAAVTELNDELNRLVEEEDEGEEATGGKTESEEAAGGEATEGKTESEEAAGGEDTEGKTESEEGTGGESEPKDQSAPEPVSEPAESKSAFKAPTLGISTVETPATFEVPEL